jgi:site-specific DNA-methyltransferase (cytosine-N4-specific)
VVLRVTPFIADSDFTLYVGDVRDVLAEMPDGSVDCVVTSPPYWGLRDYGTGVWEGGDPGCDHKSANPSAEHDEGRERAKRYKDEGRSTGQHGGWEGRAWRGDGSSTCRCGASRVDQQIGLEPTPETYVEQMVAVFRQVRRVLSDHGTCWVNLGDSYASAWACDRRNVVGSGSLEHGKREDRPNRLVGGLKEKDLVGIPWRVAFALQADGWYLRSDIIWSKPNPMPESVTDRPTKAHEYVFLLSKQPRYFFDQEAVREKYQDGPGLTGGAYAPPGQTPHGNARGPDGRHTTRVLGAGGSIQHRDGERWPNGGRNIRSVWEIATQPYPEAHFATFPEALAERCIKAGCPEGGVVLDPFMGSGTVALVARNQRRHSVGIELNEDYARLCARRLQQLSLLSQEVS